jgi:hypothetical protein
MTGVTAKTRASATISVSRYEPTICDQPAEGPVLTRIHVEETFAGAGVAEFLEASRADGSATFVGLERFNGSLAEREGTFLLQDAGTVNGSTPTT